MSNNLVPKIHFQQQNQDAPEIKKLSNNPKIIAIVGLMGAGKSTLGNRLAKKLKFYFIDSDLEIEERNRCSINQIFAKKGERYFRKIEAEVIAELINRNEDIVLSLGGGAFLEEKTRQILKEKALIIWLHAPINETLHRISGNRNRPLLNHSDKRQVLEDLIQIRYPIYGEADLDFDTTQISHEDIIYQIEQRLLSCPKSCA